jgi:MFS family permease
MQSVSLPWLVLGLGGSPLDVGLVVALQYVSVPVVAPLAGVVADRVDKRRLLVLLHGSAMAVSAVLFGMTVSEVIRPVHVFVLAAVLGVLTALEMPVRQSFLAELVPRTALRSAIALTMTGFNGARMVGPALAGIAIATVGVGANFGLNTIGYLAVLAALVAIGHGPPRMADAAPAGIRAALREGLGYAWRTPTVSWPLILLGGVAVLGMNFQVLLPLLARTELRLGGEGYGLLLGALGLGSLIGSVAVTILRPRSWRPIMLGGGGAFVTSELLLGLGGPPIVAAILVVAMGVFAMLMVTAVNLTIQESVDHALRGRVMSLYVTVYAGAVPLGGLFAGIVAERWNASAGLWIGAALSGVVLAICALRMARPDRRPGPMAPATPDLAQGPLDRQPGRDAE